MLEVRQWEMWEAGLGESAARVWAGDGVAQFSDRERSGGGTGCQR